MSDIILFYFCYIVQAKCNISYFNKESESEYDNNKFDKAAENLFNILLFF